MIELVLLSIFIIGPAVIILYSVLITFLTQKMYIAPLITAVLLFLMFASNILNVGIVPGFMYTMVSVAASVITFSLKRRAQENKAASNKRGVFDDK